MKVFSLYRFTLKIRAMQTLQFHHHHKVDTQITTRFLKEYLSEEKSITNQILKTSARFHGHSHGHHLDVCFPQLVGNTHPDLSQQMPKLIIRDNFKSGASHVLDVLKAKCSYGLFCLPAVLRE